MEEQGGVIPEEQRGVIPEEQRCIFWQFKLHHVKETPRNSPCEFRGNISILKRDIHVLVKPPPLRGMQARI